MLLFISVQQTVLPGHLDLSVGVVPTYADLHKMAFPSPLCNRREENRSHLYHSPPMPLASHRFPSFWEEDGISDLTASLSSYVLALMSDTTRAPSRIGCYEQGLLR